jgi:hypothetical protein
VYSFSAVACEINVVQKETSGTPDIMETVYDYAFHSWEIAKDV